MQNARSIVIWLAIGINALALLVFLGLYLLMPLATDVVVRSNYTELDRAGVIDTEALEQFHPDYEFTTSPHRNSVPRWIAGPALRAERSNALLGVFVATANLLLLVLIQRSVRISAQPGTDGTSAHAGSESVPSSRRRDHGRDVPV